MNIHDEHTTLIDEAKALLETQSETIHERDTEFIVFLIMGGVPWSLIAKGLALSTIITGIAGFVQLFGFVAILVTCASWCIKLRNNSKKVDKLLDQAQANLHNLP